MVEADIITYRITVGMANLWQLYALQSDARNAQNQLNN